MTTRACDFSSFKRPARPPNNSGSSQTASEKTSSLRSNELDVSTEDNSDRNNHKFMTSQSVDPNMNKRGNYQYLGGSISTFKEATSPTYPASLSSFSAQNVDTYSSFQRAPKVNHSTIDRTTLPYDRRHPVSKYTPVEREFTRHDESGVGSGLVFVDGGRRGVMNADSQHSLDESLSGRRMDRSLAKSRNGEKGCAYADNEPYDKNTPYNCDSQYSQRDNALMRNNDGCFENNIPAYDGYYNHFNNAGEAVPPQLPFNDFQNGRQGSQHNVSSGESGIVGCDYNTLGMSYEARGGRGGNGAYGYNPAAVQLMRSYEPQSVSYPTIPYPTNQQEGGSDLDDSQSRLHRTTESRMSDKAIRENSRDGSSARRDECSPRTLLIATDSAVRFGTNGSGQNMAASDQNSGFSIGGDYAGSHKTSVPVITSRTSHGSGKLNFNLFKKKNKTPDSIYRRNNLYASKSKKTAKLSTQVGLESGGVTTTGLSFEKRPYTPTKRPFCPRWQCIALTAAIGIVLLFTIGLTIYFYVWPSVLQPLVESSKPVDGEWGHWKPWFECSASCGAGIQNRTRECDSPSPEDGGKECEGSKYDARTCNAPIECPDCSRVCDVGTLSRDCRSCTCEGHIITGKITDEYKNPLAGVKVYKGSGATLLLGGTNNEGEFQFEGVCSNGDNELRLEKEMYRISRVYPTQSTDDEKAGSVSFSMIRLFLPTFTMNPSSEERLAGQKVVLCCEAESEQLPTRYVWYKDHSRLDPSVYRYSLKNPSLALPELMVFDGGEYACEVQNEAGTVRSDPATLTVYGNWTDLCHPTPREKFVTLPEGCTQTSFNTGSCGREETVQPVLSDPEGLETSYPRCIAPNQYPNDSPNDVCSGDLGDDLSHKRHCCKPTEEEEVTVECKLQDLVYNVSVKRVLSCGCALCD